MLLLMLILLGAQTPEDNVNRIAENYVKLVLAAGQQDPDYVDAFYGPAEWKQQAEKEKKPLQQIRKEAEELLNHLQRLALPHSEMERLRHEYLRQQLESLCAFADLRLGKKFTFDEESKALYDAVSPHYPKEHYQKLLDELDSALPGKGSLEERFSAFQNDFVIPRDRLDKVFQLALSEARKRTRKYIPLPEGESFQVEYVTNKPWSGYNWYKGNYHSVIEINTDLPIFIDRAMDLAGHEGYPGHHVYNVLLEQELLRKRKWIEFSVYPLYSSQSLIAEGSANYGVEILFTGKEREDFERTVLFPAAGLDPSRVGEYYRVMKIVSKLNYAGNEAARGYLDGEWTEDQAADWLAKYGLYTKDRARKRLDFIRKYRSYVINYNLGEDLVRNYIEKRGVSQEERWKELAQLLGSPRLPSSLQ
jgi:hypothetical protein